MTKPTYQKYGGFAAPDFDSLVKGQQAVSNSIKDAFTGVEGLLKKTQDVYKDRNTFNMQEQLKKNITEAGLGGEPVDRTSIQQQFGNLIDMDQLDKTILGETKKLEDDAINQASLSANQSLSSSNDPLQARKTFEDKIRSMGGKEKFTTAATQAWSDTNATKFKDIETIKLREQSTRTNRLAEEMVNNGVGYGPEAIEMLIANMPEEQQYAARVKLEADLENMSKLSPDQLRKHQSYMKLQTAYKQNAIQKAQYTVDDLTSKQSALQKDGISDVAKATAGKLGSVLGGSVTQEIGNKLTNWFESLGRGNDSDRFWALRDELSTAGIEDDDADAIMVQAFNSTYRGDGTFFNDMKEHEIDAAFSKARALAKNVKDKTMLVSQITQARQNVANTSFNEEEKLINLDRTLYTAGQNARLRFKNAMGIDTAFENTQASRANISAAIPAGAGSVGTTTPGTDKPSAITLAKMAQQQDLGQQRDPNDPVYGAANLPAVPPETPEELPVAPDAVTGEEPWQNRTLWDAFKSSRAKTTSAKEIRIKEALSKAPSTDQRAEQIMALPINEQAGALDQLEDRLGKSLTKKVRSRLNKMKSDSSDGGQLSEAIKALRNAGLNDQADALEASKGNS